MVNNPRTNATLLLPSSYGRPKGLQDPYDIRASDYPDFPEYHATITTEIYGYGNDLDIEVIYFTWYHIIVDIQFPSHRDMGQRIGEEPQVYIGKKLTVIFHPRPETTWAQWLEAAQGLEAFFKHRMTAPVVEEAEGFSFQFILVADGDDPDRGDIGYGLLEATPRKTVA